MRKILICSSIIFTHILGHAQSYLLQNNYHPIGIGFETGRILGPSILGIPQNSSYYSPQISVGRKSHLYVGGIFFLDKKFPRDSSFNLDNALLIGLDYNFTSKSEVFFYGFNIETHINIGTDKGLIAFVPGVKIGGLVNGANAVYLSIKSRQTNVWKQDQWMIGLGVRFKLRVASEDFDEVD